MDFCITFSRGYSLIRDSHTRPLSLKDVLDMHEQVKSEAVVAEYHDMVLAAEASLPNKQRTHGEPIDTSMELQEKKAQEKKSDRKVKKINLFWTLLRLNRHHIFVCCGIALIRLVGMFLQVFSLWNLLLFISGDPWNDHIAIQIMFAVLLGFGAFLQSLGQHNMFHEMYHCGLRARTLLCSLVFEKLMQQTPLHASSSAAHAKDNKGGASPSSAISPISATIQQGPSPKAKKSANDTTFEVSSGQLLNLVTSDAYAVVDGFLMSIFLVAAPFEIFGSLLWSYAYTGWAFTVTLGVLILLLPVQFWLGSTVGRLRDASFVLNDRRIRAIREFFGGIGVVKLCAWESNVVDLVSTIRDDEAVHLKHGNVLKLCNLTFFFIIPGVLSLTHFGIKMLYDTKMTAVNTFVTMALLGTCARTFQMIPRSTTSIGNALSALRRIEAYLSIDMLEGLARVDTENAPNDALVAEGSFGWHGFQLRDVKLRAERGTLTVVVGPVGCGKSTLLHALLGNCAAGVDAATGEALPYVLRRPASVAYVSQEAWIRDGSVRDNITFGRAFEAARYRDVLHACSLEDDILQWGGDGVEVGEKGVTLSGGQKQRLSMARACYADADVYLLDDPISAVDAKVALHLLEVCLKGYLREKTVILATHHPAPPRFADQLLIIGPDGRQEACGAPSQVLSMLSPSIRETSTALVSPSSSKAEDLSITPKSASDASYVRPQRSEVDQLIGKGRQLWFTEESAMGSVKSEVYKTYLSRSGWVGAIFLVMLLSGQAIRSGAEWWFSAWSSNRFGSVLLPRDYVLVELGFVVGVMVVGTLRAAVYAVMMTNNNTAIHNTMLHHVLHSPMHFFESTPLGRIANRFSKDVDNADDMLTRLSFDFVQLICVALGSLALVIYSVYWFAIVIAVFLVLFGFLFRFYIPSSRYLKRIEATSRSPSVQVFQSTLSGLPVIKVFGLDTFLRKNFLDTLDVTSQAILTSDTCQRWVGVRMDWMTVVWAIAVALLTVFLRESLGASICGLALSQSINLTGILQYAVRMAAETESYMTSVERIVEYGELPLEENAGTLAPAASEWPTRGAIEVRGLTACHVSNPTEQVLRDVTFSIAAGEKVAVVGRTGAGKSTLLSAFFRLLPVPAGAIVVDGVAISDLELSVLRSRMGVIPQAPTLFHGTLRYNLDPFGRHSDEELLVALRKVQLDELVRVRGLDADIGEAGGSMSVGQKQLLCAARALLGSPRILFMDEATANVDEATDASIQRVIREECRDVTVITIAHRLNTIMDYDKVLVLARGVLVECGNPQELASRDPTDDANVFAQMCQAMDAAQRN